MIEAAFLITLPEAHVIHGSHHEQVVEFHIFRPSHKVRLLEAANTLNRVGWRAAARDFQHPGVTSITTTRAAPRKFYRVVPGTASDIEHGPEWLLPEMASKSAA